MQKYLNNLINDLVFYNKDVRSHAEFLFYFVFLSLIYIFQSDLCKVVYTINPKRLHVLFRFTLVVRIEDFLLPMYVIEYFTD